jgi:hypothetical protein
MTELMVNCFEIDGFTEHELSVFRRPLQPFNVFCSKSPQEVDCVRPLLALERNLWVIYMMRDPRDVVVSRHGQEPDKYWTNLRMWKHLHRVAAKASHHPRFLTVRYEDLVTDPARVQGWLRGRMPFLRMRASFSDFHEMARPSKKSLEALGEVRPINGGSVGTWRRHKPRLAAQLLLHGSITRDLIDLGYEPDDAWLRELDGVVPDNQVSRWPERLSPWERIRRTAWRHGMTAAYALGVSPRERIEPPRRVPILGSAGGSRSQ